MLQLVLQVPMPLCTVGFPSVKNKTMSGLVMGPALVPSLHCVDQASCIALAQLVQPPGLRERENEYSSEESMLEKGEDKPVSAHAAGIGSDVVAHLLHISAVQSAHD